MFLKGFILPFLKLISASLVGILLLSCSSNNYLSHEKDPFEPLNRKTYAFNNSIDENIARPIAKAYEKHIPQPIQTGVHNFYGNLEDILISGNNLLQLKFKDAATDVGRFTINSTVGVLGIFDLASDYGLKKHNEDLNQTLGYWGVPDGPYLVLPLLGSYNLRGAVSAAVQTSQFAPLNLIQNNNVRNGMFILDFFDTRVQLLLASDILDSAALDPYSYVRESFIQRQLNLIHDGNPPEEDFDELDFLD